MSRREERKVREAVESDLSTRERILKVALEVFAEKGLHGATMTEIASGADLTGGALYRYFENKEDIFQAVVEERSVPFAALDMVRGMLPELEPRTALKFVIQGMFLFFYSEVDFMRVVVGESVKDPGSSRHFMDRMMTPAREFILECLELWKEKGLVRDVVDPVIAADAFLGMVGLFLVEQAFFSDPGLEGLEVDQVSEQFVTVFLDGVLS